MTTRTRPSLDEFLARPDIDERRLELLDGEVYEKASPLGGHESEPCSTRRTRSGPDVVESRFAPGFHTTVEALLARH